MKKLIITSLSLGMLFGCASSGNSKLTSIGSMGNIEIVQGSMRSIRNANGLITAQAVLHNNGSSTVSAFYRCKFFDTNQMQVGDDQVWMPVSIYQNSDQGIKCMANTAEATDFKFEFSADAKNVNNF